MSRLCVYCKHFNLDMGSPGFSEYTPGDDAVIECRKGHWRMHNGDYAGTDAYRGHIRRAETCSDFEDYQP